MRNVIFILLLFMIFVNTSCARARMDKEAQIITGRLTLEQKIGQMIMSAIPGVDLNKNGEMIIEKYLPGGIILFGYNLSEKKSIKDFIDQMQQKSMDSSGIPLFISIDQEGGRVKRVVREVTQFPGNMASGSAGDGELVYMMARILGMQLRMLGINMNLAPVLDVNNNPDNPVINIRSFGPDPKLVSSLGIQYIRGLQESYCIAVGKHFPGHGDTNKDSHHTLPVINYDLERLYRIEFPPFIDAIRENVEGIMTAHISFPAILKRSEPATLSREFLTDILREKMKFTGLVFTDDMEMKAVSSGRDMGEAAIKSIIAGADVILLTTSGNSVNAIVDSIKKGVKEKRIDIMRIDESVKRIIEVKLRYKIMAFKNNKIETGNIVYSKGDNKNLDKTGIVNAELSRKAIYFKGDYRLLLPDKSVSRMIITANRHLKENLELHEKDRILSSERELKFSGDKIKGDMVVFYHIEDLNPNLNRLKHLAKTCREKGAGLVVLSSGNPYPLMGSAGAESILISFSDTDESMKQLAFCINGKFKPGMNGNIFTGISKGK